MLPEVAALRSWSCSCVQLLEVVAPAAIASSLMLAEVAPPPDVVSSTWELLLLCQPLEVVAPAAIVSNLMLPEVAAPLMLRPALMSCCSASVFTIPVLPGVFPWAAVLCPAGCSYE